MLRAALIPSLLCRAAAAVDRDVHGHGTHTAATSAGNFGVLGSLSGMAPRARIVVYKVSLGC